MDASHPAVHPLGVIGAARPRGRMKDLQGMPGTVGGLALRIGQLGFAVCAMIVMIRVKDFKTITAFSYLVWTMGLQCAWSLSLGIIDLCTLHYNVSLRTSPLISLFVIGDWVFLTFTFAAACASTGIAVLIDHDLKVCGDQCSKYEAAAAMTFLTWLMVTPSFFFTFWLLATRHILDIETVGVPARINRSWLQFGILPHYRLEKD